MKKLIGTAMFAALLATSAFAEITFGSWLRVLAAPVAYNGDDIKSGMANSWGYGARTARVDINATSEDEKVGFSMQVFNDAWDGLSAGDNFAIWAKPWDFLKVSFGQWDYTSFRGDLTYGSWAWLRPNNWLFDDEGLTFDKLGAKNGIQLELTPIEGLLVMWNLPLAKGFEGDAYKMFEQQDIAAKYTIGDIGTIKVGWGGKGERKYKKEGVKKGYNVKDKTGKVKNYASHSDVIAAIEKEAAAATPDETLLKNLVAASTFDFDDENAVYATKDSGFSDEVKYLGDINVAFDLTAVENLFVTVGAKISIADSDYKGNDFDLLKVAAGASYQILDNLKVSASFGLQTHQTKGDAKHKPDFQFGVGLDYGLTDALTLNADFRGLIWGDTEANGKTADGPDPSFSFLVGLQYALSSNGYVGIGFQGLIAGKTAKKTDSSVFPAQADKFSFAVPVAVSVSF